MAVVAAYLAVILIWSTTPLAIKFSNESLSFIAAVSLRMLLGGAICAALLLLTRRRLPLQRRALMSYAAANLGVFGAMSLLYLAILFIPSGLTSVIFGLAPILSGVFARRLLDEPPLTRLRTVALGLSVLGLALVFQGELAVSLAGLPGLLATLAAVTLFALSGVLVKRWSAGLDALTQTTGALLMSLPLFALSWLVLDGVPPTAVSTRSMLAVIYLALAGSVIGFMLYFFVLQRLPATTVALIPLITPVLALALGHLLAGETVTRTTVAGGGFILSALALYQWGARRVPTGARSLPH